MRYNEYIRLKTGRYQSVGKFGDHIYAYEVLTGINRPVICSRYLGRAELNTSLLRDM